MSTLLDADSINVLVDNPETPFGGVIVDLPDSPVVIELNSTTAPVKSVFGRVGDILALQADYSAFYAPLGGEIPPGGSINQILTKLSGTDRDVGWADNTSSSPANPTASVGLTAVNGTASTFLRSDGAPALNVSIAPTWSGIHTFSVSPLVPAPSGANAAVNKTYVDAASGTPGGSNTQVQYDNAGAFGGITGATTDGTVLTLTDPISNNLTLQGNQSVPAWTTNGVRLKGVTGTLTDTTSSGTVAAAYTNVLGGNTIAATSATVFTNYYSLFAKAPLNGANVSFTNKWAIGCESLLVGTTNPVKISNSGALVLTAAATLATPASGTLTNCTGLPISGLVASTSTALGVGSIELGHATDTTLSRASAGVLAVEGVNVLLNGGALGTPSSGTLTNCTFPTLNQNTTGSAASLSISGQTGLMTVTGLVSTNRIKTVRDADDTILELGGSYTPTGTWTNMIHVAPALGTPSSGTLTSCTGLPISGLVASTSTALGVGTIELGHATDTTIARSGAGAITVEGVQVILSGAALGTPSSGTLTNCTGLPIAGLTASTSTALGVGSIELGHATDTTIARSGAGAITVEGVQVILSGAALGTPSSGTLTNCTGLPIAGLTASTSTALGVGTIELGHATDTTIARSGAGAITVEGVQVILSGAALGTPSSGTLTNCTFPTLNQSTTGSAASLSISGQSGLMTVTGLASTNRIKTVRDAADTILELGGSYTPTGTWTSLTMVTPILGTPTSGTLTNCGGTAASLTAGHATDAISVQQSGGTGLISFAGMVNTNRIKTVRDAADTILELGGSYTPTGTWTSITMVTPVLGTPTSGTLTNCTIPDSATRTHDLTAIPNDTGGWNEYFVTGSDFTTSNTTATNITGMQSGTLSTSTWYEFEFVLRLLNAADTAGMRFGYTDNGGTGTAASVFSTFTGNSSAAGAAAAGALNAVDTVATALVTYSGAEGIVFGRGHFKSRSTGTPTFQMTMAKVTSNLATVRVGSQLRIRKLHT